MTVRARRLDVSSLLGKVTYRPVSLGISISGNLLGYHGRVGISTKRVDIYSESRTAVASRVPSGCTQLIKS